MRVDQSARRAPALRVVGARTEARLKMGMKTWNGCERSTVGIIICMPHPNLATAERPQTAWLRDAPW